MKALRVACFVVAGLGAIVAAAQAVAVVVENYLARNVFGFNPSGIHDTVDTYRVKDLDCVAWLDPLTVTEEPGTAGNFFAVLSGAFPPGGGRSYASFANPLSAGTIEIHTYDVQGTPARVGAEIDVEYAPAAADPQNDIHWIQVVTNNHRIGGGGGHGVNDNKVDIPGTATTPYYDDGFAADSGNCGAGCDFYDFPGRVDTANSHTWSAVTHLAEGPAVGAPLGPITLTHPGFLWGWKNVCVPAFVGEVYRAVTSGPVRLATTSALAPGAIVDLAPVSPAQMTLTKGTRTATVVLANAGLQIAIDPKVDAAGMSAYTLRTGQGQFQAYTFGSEIIGPSAFTLESGNGWIQWESGEISAHVTFRVSVAGFADVVGVADGTGQIDFEAGIITVDPDSLGLENASIAAIPTVSVLGLLMLAILFLCAGFLVMRWH